MTGGSVNEASQEPLQSTMEEAALSNGTGDVSTQQQATHNGHGSESGPVEQEETEEIERDVHKIGMAAAPENTPAFEVYGNDAETINRSLLGQDSEHDQIISVESLERRMTEITDDEDQYQVICTWVSLKLDLAQKDAEQLARAWEMAQNIDGFGLKHREDKKLWARVRGVNRRYYTTEERKRKNWDLIKRKVGPEAYQVLREAGTGCNYSEHLRALFKADVESGVRKLVAAVVHRLENCCSKRSARNRLRPGDAAVARKMPDPEYIPEDLTGWGLQKGIHGLPEPLGRAPLNIENRQSNDQPNTSATEEAHDEVGQQIQEIKVEQPAKDEELEVTGRKRPRKQYEEEAEETEEEEVESRSIEAFKDIQNERRNVDNSTINSSFLEGILGQHQAILRKMRECGAFEVPDQWLRHIYSEGCPSFSEMAALEEKVIREKTKDLGINHDPRLWTMVFSPCQQAMRLDLGLYAATVLWRNDGLFDLYSLPEPAWSRCEERNEGVLAHLGHPTGAIGKHISGGTNTWSPVFLVGMTKGELGEWCGPLDVNTANLKKLEESWNIVVERNGADRSEQDAFLAVEREEYEARFSPGGGTSHEKLLAVHPNGAIGFSGMYGAALMFPVQFVPAADSKSARKWAKSLQPPPKTMSGRKFLAKAAGRWPPLVMLRPRNSLACALAGWADWNDLDVERELDKLFRAPDQAAVERYIFESRTDLWCDTYRAHVEFMNTVGRYYG